MTTVALVAEIDEQGHRAFFLQAMRDLDEIDAAVVVDPTGATFDEARRTLNHKLKATYRDVGEMLRRESPNLAIVSMIAAHAPPVIRELLEAGVHVMAEKPASTDPDEFASLVRLADRHNRHLIVPLARRMSPWVQDARRIFHGGGIGHLYAIRGSVIADQARIWPASGKRDWTFSKALAGGGHLVWLGIHWIDLMLYITGERVEEVQAMTAVVGGAPIDVEDLALVNLRFSGGAHASLLSGYLLDKPYQMDLTLWGSTGWLRFGAQDRHVLEWHGADAAVSGAFDRSIRYSGPFFENYTPWIARTVRASLGKPAPITGAEALTVLRIVHAAYESADTGRTVKL